jgi:prevent-host-death family protein
MKHAKVSELKARLSEYLAGVRRGGSVVVYDRATPIARLVPFSERDGIALEIEEPTLGVAALRDLRPVRPRRKIDVVRILRESRDQR